MNPEPKIARQVFVLSPGSFDKDVALLRDSVRGSSKSKRFSVTLGHVHATRSAIQNRYYFDLQSNAHNRRNIRDTNTDADAQTMVKFFDVVVKLGITELTFSSIGLWSLSPSRTKNIREVLFLPDLDTKLVFSKLRKITIRDCSSTLDFLEWLVTSNSKLERVEIVILDPADCLSENLQGRLFNALNSNYNLLQFEFRYECGNINIDDRGILAQHQRVTDQIALFKIVSAPIFNRNRVANDKCKNAVYTLLSIYRHRRDSWPAKIARDVVFLIAKLVHASSGTQIWA